LDSNIYSYYSEIISQQYELALRDRKIEDSVTAYRKIKVDQKNESSRNKCNIDFANDIFCFIKGSKDIDLVAITFDIKSFFDNLDHKILKKSWRDVIKSGTDLPLDHYNIFRSITKYSFIEEDDLFSEFKNEILVARKPEIIKKIKVKKKKYLREKRAVAYCTKDNIERIRSKGLIKSNKYTDKERKELREKGIPQGSPISALLANMYMLDFDSSADKFIKERDGIYRRYSDDMVVVCPDIHKEDVINYFNAEIKRYELEIQESKTQIAYLKYFSKEQRYYVQNNKSFEYLGFQFDGFTTLLKSASLAGYYRKMKRSFARSRFFTFHNNTETKGELFKSRLYKRFTHVGSNRRRIYQRHPEHKNKFILSYKYDWGNYITYSKHAAKIIPDNEISGQLKRHWKNFHKMIIDIERTSKNNEGESREIL
jgi:hypothetical protein